MRPTIVGCQFYKSVPRLIIICAEQMYFDMPSVSIKVIIKHSFK